nr:acyl dehydratase [Verticiella sediminum]
MLGTTWHTAGRTLTETDLVSFVNLTWFTEDLFTNQHDTGENAIQGRPVPAGMVFTMAEGLVVPSLERAGLAFLQMELDVRSPTFVGDTIRVDCEVIEARECSKPDRGLVRTKNTVTNAGGQILLIYRPLRLIKRRSPAQADGRPR